MKVEVNSFRAKAQQINIGWMTQAYLIEMSQVLEVTEPDGRLSLMTGKALPGCMLGAGQLQLSDHAQVQALDFMAKSTLMKETALFSPDGKAYKLEISGQLLFHPGVLNWLEQNQERDFLMLFRDTSGNCFLAGDQERGLRLSFDRSLSANNLILLTLSGSFTHTIYQVETLDLARLFIGSVVQFNQ